MSQEDVHLFTGQFNAVPEESTVSHLSIYEGENELYAKKYSMKPKSLNDGNYQHFDTGTGLRFRPVIKGPIYDKVQSKGPIDGNLNPFGKHIAKTGQNMEKWEVQFLSSVRKKRNKYFRHVLVQNNIPKNGVNYLTRKEKTNNSTLTKKSESSSAKIFSRRQRRSSFYSSNESEESFFTAMPLFERRMSFKITEYPADSLRDRKYESGGTRSSEGHATLHPQKENAAPNLGLTWSMSAGTKVPTTNNINSQSDEREIPGERGYSTKASIIPETGSLLDPLLKVFDTENRATEVGDVKYAADDGLKGSDRDFLHYKSGFGSTQQEGCDCWETHDEFGIKEIECRCRGSSVTSIPTTLHSAVNRL